MLLTHFRLILTIRSRVEGGKPAGDLPLLHYLLLTTYYLLPLLTAYHLLLTTCCLPLAAYYLLLTPYRLILTIRYRVEGGKSAGDIPLGSGLGQATHRHSVCAVFSVWFSVCGVRCVVCGVWCVACGVWRAVCGVWCVCVRVCGV